MKAFPLKAVNLFDDNEGMDLRDYFAAKAMAALITHPYIEESTKEEGVDHADFVSYLAYQVANAMMKERDETT
jgi:hypothetical protein